MIAGGKQRRSKTAHHIGAALLDACGLAFLLAPEKATL